MDWRSSAFRRRTPRSTTSYAWHRSFGNTTPEWTDAMLFFVSSFDAARNWMLDVLYGDRWGGPGPDAVERWNRQLRARYSLDVAKHEEYLEILPLAWDQQSYPKY